MNKKYVTIAIAGVVAVPLIAIGTVHLLRQQNTATSPAASQNKAPTDTDMATDTRESTILEKRAAESKEENNAVTKAAETTPPAIDEKDVKNYSTISKEEKSSRRTEAANSIRKHGSLEPAEQPTSPEVSGGILSKP